MNPARNLRRLLSNINSLPNTSSEVKPFDTIPGPKPLPVVGNVWRYLPLIGNYKPETLFENAQYNKQRYGPIVREQLTKSLTILHLFDPNDIKSFIKQDAKEPYRRSHRALLKYRLSRPERYNDGGLFPENGPSWSRLRKLFQLGQISPKASLLDQVALDTIRDIVLSMKNSTFARVKQFEQILYRWAIKSSLVLFLDCDPKEKIDDRLIEQLILSLHDELEAIDGTEIKSEKWNQAPSKCPFFQKLAKSEDFLYEFIETRIEHLIKTNSLRENSFLHKWLIVHKLERRDVITFVIDSILAGLHTTTYTTMFLLKNISKSGQEIRRLLEMEIQKNVPNVPNLITSDVIDNMAHMKDCLKETLRLNPVSIGTGRLTRYEMQIRDYKIPKDIMVIAQTQAICRDPNIYEEPDRFKPERWAKYRALPREQSSLAQLAWKPFGFGPRTCIGQSLASLQITILASRILQHFDIKFINKIKTKTTLIHNIDGHVEVEFNKILAH